MEGAGEDQTSIESRNNCNQPADMLTEVTTPPCPKLALTEGALGDPELLLWPGTIVIGPDSDWYSALRLGKRESLDTISPALGSDCWGGDRRRWKYSCS